MDEVKRLLEQFADRTVDGLPPADVEADVARGRRALRRIRARRRATGVLVLAAATTAVLVLGDPTRWLRGGTSDVADDQATTSGTSAPAETQQGSASPGVLATPGQASDPTVPEDTPMMSAATVRLVANRASWGPVACSLAPQGWSTLPPSAGKVVVLAPSSVRTATDVDSTVGMELLIAPEPQPLTSPRSPGYGVKEVQVGSSGGREIGQVKLGDQWLVARLPLEHQDWTDDTVHRFLDSCTVS